MKKKIILKVLALLPHFLFRRLVKLLYPKKILSTENTFEEIISNQELLKEKLFDLKNEDTKKTLRQKTTDNQVVLVAGYGVHHP